VSEVLRNPQAAPRSRTPDGRYAFVTHGGDGKVSVVDTERLSVQQVRVPTALRGGGYITAVQKGAEPVDLMAR
jgi:YVTN family beta-propeller protein